MRVVSMGGDFKLEILFTDLLRRAGNAPRLVVVRNLSGKACEISLSQADTRCEATVAPGQSTWLFSVERGPVKIVVLSDRKMLEKCLELEPPRTVEFDLIMFSHVDLGYTASISEVEKLQALYTAKALEYHRNSLAFPEESRFRWNIETTWALSCFEKVYGPDQAQKVHDLLKVGEFGIGALFLHHYADRAEFEELFHSLRKVRSLKAAGISIKSAFLSDVPGMSTGLLELLAESGVENLFMSINNFVAPFKEYTNLRSPFWWKLPGGKRILTWFTDDPKWAYIEGYRFFGSDLKTLEGEILEKLVAMDGRGYGLPVFAIPMAIDNREPVFVPVELIKEWNLIWRNPRITTATIDGFFERLRSFASNLPEIEGEFNGWWTSNVLAYPRENSLSSITFSMLHEAALLNHVSGGGHEEEIEEGFELLSGFDEHSGGGGLYLSKDPEAILEAVSQGFGWIFRASRLSGRILVELRESLFGSGRYITVLNPTGVARNDFCVMDCDDPDLGLKASDGTYVPSLFYSGKLYFYPGRLEAFEHRSFLPGKVMRGARETSHSKGGLDITTCDYELSFNDRGELCSVVVRESDRELLSPPLTAGRLKIVRLPVNPVDNLSDAINHDELYTGRTPPGSEEDYLPLECGHRVFESAWGTIVEFEPLDLYCRPFRKTYLLPTKSGEIILAVRFNYVYGVGPSDFLFLEVPLGMERPKISYRTSGRIARLEDLISGSGTDTLTVLGALRIESPNDRDCSLNIGLEGINLVDFESPSPLQFRPIHQASGRLFFRLFSGNLQNRFASPFLNGEPMEFAVRLSIKSSGLCRYSAAIRHPLSVFRSDLRKEPLLAGLRASENVELFFGRDNSTKTALFAKEIAGETGYLYTGEGIRYTLEPYSFIRVRGAEGSK